MFNRYFLFHYIVKGVSPFKHILYFCKMKKRLGSFLIILLSFITLYSCDGYNKLLKSKDFEKKYEAAQSYFDKKDYFKAQQLFDELLVVYRGTPRAEEVFFKYAFTYFYLGDYIKAAHFFQRYAATFPKSKESETAFYMSAYCKYLDSPKYSLDQTSTYEAIQQLQSFINIFPSSDSIARCNQLMDELRFKLEQKAFEKAKLYHTTGYDRSATSALTLFVKEHPGSVFREEALFLILEASYRYARQSVETKREERMRSALQAYQNLEFAFPNSKYLSTAQGIKRKIDTAIVQLNQ